MNDKHTCKKLRLSDESCGKDSADNILRYQKCRRHKPVSYTHLDVYKRQAMRSTRFKSVDARVGAINDTELETRVYTDASGFSYRLDGNNVDIDTETARLAENQIRYNGLVQSMNEEFTNLKMVMK